MFTVGVVAREGLVGGRDSARVGIGTWDLEIRVCGVRGRSALGGKMV